MRAPALKVCTFCWRAIAPGAECYWFGGSLWPHVLCPDCAEDES